MQHPEMECVGWDGEGHDEDQMFSRTTQLCAEYYFQALVTSVSIMFLLEISVFIKQNANRNNSEASLSRLI